MKVLTLTQPWASLVMAGEKRMETRSWQTSYRGPLAIHAAKGWTGDDRWFATQVCGRMTPLTIATVDDLPRGAVLGIVELLDVHPTEGLPVGERERFLGDYGPGRYAWVLAVLEVFPEPVPAKGMLASGSGSARRWCPMADLRALTAAATPGPWNADGLTLRLGTIWDAWGDDIARAWSQADANLIVAAVNALPALLDEIDRLRAVAGLAEEALAATGDHHALPNGYCLDCQGGCIGPLARENTEAIRKAAFAKPDPFGGAS